MLTIGVSPTVIRGYLEAASESYGLEPAKIDLSKPPCEEFVVWLLGTPSLLSFAPLSDGLPERRHLDRAAVEEQKEEPPRGIQCGI
jgi:hypothetical protein